MKKRIISLLLAIFMISSLFVGCGKKEEDVGKDKDGEVVNKNSEGDDKEGDEGKKKEDDGEKDSDVPDYMNATGFPIAKEKINIKIMGGKWAGGTEYEDYEIFKRMEELTNIHFEFDLAEPSTYPEKKNIALAGGEYPDVFLMGIEVSEEEKYGSQGIFIDLKPYIEGYAPNLQKRMAEHPDIEPAITAIDDKIYGLPGYVRTSTQNPWVSFMNASWMERVNKEMPKTVDDLYELLKAYKTEDANGNGDPNDEIPWGGVGLGSFNFILAGFTGMAGGMDFDVQDDGKIVYTPALPVFKDFLEYMNKLYTEELIDQEIFTQTSQQHVAKVKNGLVGIYNVSPTTLPPETTDLQDSLEPLVSEFNDKKAVPLYQPVQTGRAVITDKCEYPEAMMRWFDIWYAKEGENIGGGENVWGETLFLGYRDEHWEYADDKKETYKWIDPITSFGDLNTTVTREDLGPVYINFMPYPANFPLMEMKVKAVQARQEPYMVQTFPATVRYTDEEIERVTLIETDIWNYIEQMIVKFITGDEPIDNFDNFVKTLEEIGLEELTKIKQDAYDRWAAVSK